jgi:hypothetical protein
MESQEYYILQLKDTTLYRNGKYCNYTYLDLPSALQTMDFFLYAVREGVAMYKLPLCYEILFEGVKYGMSLEHVNKYMIDEKMSLQYISSHPNPSLKFIPSKFVKEEFLLKAIELNQEFVKKIPVRMFTQKICDYVISVNGSLLKCIPKEFRTYEICLNAINSPRWKDTCISEIPFEQREKTICKAFMEKAKNVDYAVNYIPSHLKTTEFLKLYAERDGNIIPKFPGKFWSHQIWKLGVQSFLTRNIVCSNEFLEHCPKKLLAPLRKLIQEKERKEILKQKIIHLFTSGEDSVQDDYFPKANVEFREIDHEDHITTDPLQEGTIYAFYTLNNKKFLAGSLSMFRTFIEMKFHNSTMENLFIPLLNKKMAPDDLDWVIW